MLVALPTVGLEFITLYTSMCVCVSEYVCMRACCVTIMRCV